MAAGALASKIAICTATGAQKILEEGKPLIWWTNTIGTPDKASAVQYCKRVEDQGAKAIVLTVDNPYQSNRDRNNRNRFDYGYMQTGVPKSASRFRLVLAKAVMHKPHTPNLTWEWLEWARGASKIPVIVKGVLNPLDAALAVKHGASAISVSNHGGRQLTAPSPVSTPSPPALTRSAAKFPS